MSDNHYCGAGVPIEEYVALRDRAERLGRRATQLVDENAKLQADNDEYHAENTRLIGVHNDLQERLSKVALDWLSLEGQMREVQAERDQLKSCQASMQGDIDHLTQALTDSEAVLDSAQALIGELNNEEGANLGVDDRIAKFVTAYRNLSNWKSRDAFCHASQIKLAKAHDGVQKVMARLADLLGDDQFNNIEAMVLAAGIPYPPVQPQPVIKCWLHKHNADPDCVTCHAQPLGGSDNG